MPSQNSRNSPINHLIVTEEEYVEDLRYLLQNVTRCWDHENPLPSQLESMFNVLDMIYHHNNNFHSRLKQIGTDPKELGDTLMAWVEDMEGPYATYCQNYRRGVDLWPEIENNFNLQNTLSSLSSMRNQPVTLDWLFLLPLRRIHYYKKLYMRILKNSEPGRPDYDILLIANQRLDGLIELEGKAKEIKEPIEPIEPRESVISKPQIVENTYIAPVVYGMDDDSALNLTLSELESKLDTSNVTNLFTGQIKALNVQLLPPHLHFRREIILHDDFIIILSDGESNHKAHMNAHLILCTDLLLICQRLTAEEKEKNPSKDFLLLYQPLSGRHLSISDLRDNKEELLKLMISTATERQSIVIVANNRITKETWLKESAQVIEFSRTASARPQLSISVQEGNSNHLNTGNFLSPPLKLGLPSSPLLNGAPRSRSRSRSPAASPPSSIRSRSPAASPPSSARSRSPVASPPSSVRSRSPAASPPSSGDNLKIREDRSDVRSLDSVSSISSIASFTDTIYQSSPCEVCCWVVGEWLPMSKKEKVIVEIKMANLNRPCWTVLLESSGRMILNGWILPTTSIQREPSFSISVSCEMGQNKEYYRITSPNQPESDLIYSHFLKMKNHMNNESLAVPTQGFMSRSSSLNNNNNNNNNQAQSQAREIELSLSEVMESKVKLFLQNNIGVWTNLGWGNMKLLLETPSYRKRIIVYSDRQKSKVLVDSFITESCVQKSKSNITFKINNINTTNTTSIIYMVQMNEANASKAMEIMKTKKN